MCGGPELAIAAFVASTVAGGVQAHQANKAQKRQRGQNAIAEQRAAEQARRAEEIAAEEASRAQARQADINRFRRQNTQSSKGGASGTLLTGPTGVEASNLPLSANTLLGG